jgi:solute carrier family 25 protein 16
MPDEKLLETRPTRRPVHRRPIDKQSVEYVVRSGIAGGVAGCAAKTLIAPLDRVKILFQTGNADFKKYSGSRLGLLKATKQITNTEGAIGLFKGHSATLLRIFPYAAIKFVAYEQIRNILIRSKDQETSLRRALSGSLSGVASVFCTYPLDLIRVRLAFQTKSLESTINGRIERPRHRMWALINSIYHESSSSGSLKPHISNFYRGLVPTVMGMIPYAGVSFWAHDAIHDLFRSDHLQSVAVVMSNDETVLPATDRRRPLKVWAELLAGGMAGLCAQTASYPFEVIRRRMQVSGLVIDNRRGIMSTAKCIIQAEGIRGLFVGLSIGYIKMLPMSACSFLVYERMKYLLNI